MIKIRDSEKILASHRKTWFVFLFTGISSALMFIGPLLVYAIFPSAFGLLAKQVSAQLLWLILVLWWWAIWTGTFISFSNYYLDVFIITNERILHISQLGPFSRTVSELRLERIQDVTIEQLGLLPTLLHFGTIRVQTAGESPSFSFRTVPQPTKIKETIMEAHRVALMRHTNPNKMST